MKFRPEIPKWWDYLKFVGKLFYHKRSIFMRDNIRKKQGKKYHKSTFLVISNPGPNEKVFRKDLSGNDVTHPLKKYVFKKRL